MADRLPEFGLLRLEGAVVAVVAEAARVESHLQRQEVEAQPEAARSIKRSQWTSISLIALISSSMVAAEGEAAALTAAILAALEAMADRHTFWISSLRRCSAHSLARAAA